MVDEYLCLCLRFFCNCSCPEDAPESEFEDYVMMNGSLTALRALVESNQQLTAQNLKPKPFFYIMGICKPHTPFHYPQKFADRFPVDEEFVAQPLPFTKKFPEDAAALEWIMANEIMGQIGLTSPDAALSDADVW